MTPEEKKLAVDVWCKIVGTQEHFNQMILQVRSYLLSIVTAIVGASALVYPQGITINMLCFHMNLASLVFVAGIIIIGAFYVTEKGYYHLLIGAVKQGQDLENQMASEIPGIKLTHRISDESHQPIFFAKMGSVTRLRLFYVALCLLFVAAIFVTANSKPSPAPAPKSSATTSGASDKSAIPNDPSAGTKALKKFYATGAYLYLFDEIARAAEQFVDENSSQVDRSKGVAIIDIDDTALSTWEILDSGDFTWDAARFSNFVSRSGARKLDATLRLFKKLRSAGIPIIFLTGRSEDLRDVTVKNLAQQGFAGYTDLVMKPAANEISTKLFKDAARDKLRGAGKTIFLSIGDHLEDLDGAGTAGNFLLPNPFY